MFSFTKDQAKQLEGYGAQAKFTAIASDQSTPKEAVVCRLIDTLTGKTWCAATGPDEPTALTKALEAADPEKRPMTPAEVAAENARLRQELAAERARRDADNGKDGVDSARLASENAELRQRLAALESGHPVPPATDNEPESDDEDEDEGDGYAGMEPAELAQMLRAQGIPVPQGDKSSDEWRAAAIERLTAAQQD